MLRAVSCSMESRVEPVVAESIAALQAVEFCRSRGTGMEKNNSRRRVLLTSGLCHQKTGPALVYVWADCSRIF
jgi:hypothetical protein